MLRQHMGTKFALAAAAAAILCGIWRLNQFGQIELIGDQAFITQWVIRLAEAERFFPAPGDGSWFQRLMGDEESFLNVLLRQLYQAQVLIFITVSIALYTLFSVFFGASMESVVALSIVFSAVWLWLMAMFPTHCRKGTIMGPVEACAIGGIALALGCGSSFFNIFSAMGPHNAGVMFLVLSVTVTQRWIVRTADTGSLRAAGSLTAVMFAVQWLAIYAHYTNVFLLPAATVFALALHRSSPVGRRAGLIVRYAAVVLIGFIPAIVLAFLYSDAVGGSGNTQTFAGLTANLVLSDSSVIGATVWTRIPLWFRDITSMYSLAGLVLGVAGAAGMAWRHGLALPFTIILAHFLSGALLQIFTQYDRTGAYVLPMLMLGGGWSIVAATAGVSRIRGSARTARLSLGAVAAICIAAILQHFLTERPKLQTPGLARPWGLLVRPPVWRGIIGEVDRALPLGSVLIPWDYGLSHQYAATTSRAAGEVRLMRPLTTLTLQRRAGTLVEYIRLRGLNITAQQPVFLFVPVNIATERVQTAFRNVAGTAGFALPDAASLMQAGHWNLPGSTFPERDVRLYRVVWPDG